MQIKATMAAAKGGKPTLISRGAARAAGVPKPAAPSMKAPNTQPMMIARIRASLVTPLNMPLMADMAPERFRVFIIRMAPKMMTRVSKALRKPVMV